MKSVYAVAVALLTTAVVCRAQTSSTNAPTNKDTVFVEIKETGTREDRHSRLVVGKILECLGFWPYHTKLDAGFFEAFVETIKNDKNAGPFVTRCMEQKTLSPTGERGNSYPDFISDLAFKPQQNPVSLASLADQDIKVTITLSWRSGVAIILIPFQDEFPVTPISREV